MKKKPIHLDTGGANACLAKTTTRGTTDPAGVTCKKCRAVRKTQHEDVHRGQRRADT